MSRPNRVSLSSTSEAGGYEVLAAGFNAHKQLSTNHNNDLDTFHPILRKVSDVPEILFAGWSATAILHSGNLEVLGHQAFIHSLQDTDVYLRSGFGDHNGISGCLDQQGHFYLVEQKSDKSLSLVDQYREDSRTLSHIAQAGNDRVAVVLSYGSEDQTCEVWEFNSEDAFRQWFQNPAEGLFVDKKHQLKGRAKQLLAGIATFVLLTEGGEVYTWGDPRHRSLARSIIGQDATPADIPGYVEALGGLRITKIASGGWMSAALSFEDGAAYFWGAPMPGEEGSLRFLRESGAGSTALIELPGDDSEPLDILDIAVGENHAALLAEGNRVFVIGENQNGQLGIRTSPSTFLEDWQEVSYPGRAEALFCGPKSTFLITRPPHSPPSPHPD